MSVFVKKADGTTEPFKVGKLRHSLTRAGASKPEVNDIITTIESQLRDGMTTQEIYRNAFALLRASTQPAAARYSLRRALFNLGPTGFPFEDFLAELFKAEGYTTMTRLTLQGKCAVHELDVGAYKADDSFVVEAKFHSHPGIKSDLHVALYTYARTVDLQDQKICHQDICGINKVMLVTNTKFTSAAEKYAECAGLSMLSWTYPRHNNLQDRIERAGIYPVTVLSSLSQAEKRILLENNIIICRDMLRNNDKIHSFGISSKKLETAITEARQLCTPE